MTKTSTIRFTINNLASRSKYELADLYTVFDFENEYAEIFDMLEDASLDVRQEVVDQLLSYAAESE